MDPMLQVVYRVFLLGSYSVAIFFCISQCRHIERADKFYIGKECNGRDSTWYVLSGNPKADSIDIMEHLHAINPNETEEMHNAILADWCKEEPSDAFWKEQRKSKQFQGYLHKRGLHKASPAVIMKHFFPEAQRLNWFAFLSAALIAIVIIMALLLSMRKKELTETGKKKLQGLDFWIFLELWLVLAYFIIHQPSFDTIPLKDTITAGILAGIVVILGLAGAQVNEYFKP
jgi:hypothetical protein